MTVVLHIVARTHVAEPSPQARDLAATPWDGKATTTVRVLELFDPRGGAPIVDLAICERDIPEITALLHVVGEIHVHGVHPRTVMRALPAVRPAVLAGIAMILHGPIPDARAGDPELTWPGPIAEAPQHPVPLDLHAPDLL